ncbi:MAG: hypothetical protein ACOYYS_23200 [Chloroflexota bacterium]
MSLTLQERLFVVECNRRAIKQLPIKGLCNQKMLFQDYLDMMRKEALSEWRNWRSKHTRYD